MFNRTMYQNSRPGGVAVLEVTEKEGQQRFVPLKRTVLSGEVSGPLAALRLTQTYGYTRAQCDQVLAAAYRFPLPGDAAVTGISARFGDVEIISELQERSRAEATYQEAIKEGKQAALLTRESPDVFTLLLAGLRPDEEVTVRLSFVLVARADGEGWSLRVPLTTAPRYVRSDELSSRHAQGQPLAVLFDPGHRFALDLHFAGTGQVESRTHGLDCESDEMGLRLHLQEGKVIPDRDCVLRWRPRQEQDRTTLQIWLDEDRAAGQVHFLALVAPPALKPELRTPREAILLVDHSGSMEGAKWAAADWAAKQFLSGLGPDDRFNLGVFHNSTTWFSPGPQAAAGQAVADAARFLDEHRDSGGTELGVALEQALRQARDKGEAARHVLIVTDAEVSDAGRILRLAEDEAKKKGRRRISVICIDAAPNSQLVLQLAERGGGVARFLTSSPEEDDVTTALDEVVADWNEPLLPDLRLEAAGAGLCAAGRRVLAGGDALDLGDLPSGRAVWAVGRVTTPPGSPAGFRLLAGNGQQLASWQGATGDGANGAIRAYFGAQRLLALEYLCSGNRSEAELGPELERLGYDDKEVLQSKEEQPSPIYAENLRTGAEGALRALLVRESLHYGLVCSETGFVAARTEAGKPVQGLAVIANALPTGWSEDFASQSVMSVPMLASYHQPPPPTSPRSFGANLRAFSLGSGMGSMLRDFAQAAPQSAPPAAGRRIAPSTGSLQVFSGVPQFVGNEALLFETSAGRGRNPLPADVQLEGVEVGYPVQPAEQELQGLVLLIYVGDLAAPRASVKLVDILRQGGSRPLNLRRQAGEPVRVVLQRSPGRADAVPDLAVTLKWR